MIRQVTREVDREKYRVVHEIYQDTGETVVPTRNFDMVRWIIFNFHSIRSVIIAKLGTKSIQVKAHMYKKIDRK